MPSIKLGKKAVIELVKSALSDAETRDAVFAELKGTLLPWAHENGWYFRSTISGRRIATIDTTVPDLVRQRGNKEEVKRIMTSDIAPGGQVLCETRYFSCEGDVDRFKEDIDDVLRKGRGYKLL